MATLAKAMNCKILSDSESVCEAVASAYVLRPVERYKSAWEKSEETAEVHTVYQLLKENVVAKDGKLFNCYLFYLHYR